MDRPRDLSPCLIGEGTVSSLRDMVRALETLEGFRYSYTVDGELIAEGSAALVKLMADEESGTMLVNGCLFLNVTSFRYLSFRDDADEDDCVFELHGDGTVLRLVPEDTVESPIGERANAARMLDGTGFGPSCVRFDDYEDDLPF